MCKLTGNTISIVIRSLKDENLNAILESLLKSINFEYQFEIIIVSTGTPIMTLECFFPIKTIISKAKRIEAKKIGVNHSKYDKVLFLDSDQIIAKNLLSELSNVKEDMVFIPERSYNRNFVGRLMDKKRIQIENMMKKELRLSLPVVPRCFDRSLLIRSLDSLPPSVVKDVTEAEDTLIFYECLKYSTSISWVNTYIYNSDPILKTFLHKSLVYGLRNENAIVSHRLPPEYVKAIRHSQRHFILNNGSLSTSVLLFNILRGVPFIIGTTIARIKYKR